MRQPFHVVGEAPVAILMIMYNIISLSIYIIYIYIYSYDIKIYQMSYLMSLYHGFKKVVLFDPLQ
jgi:hypothetical protein